MARPPSLPALLPLLAIALISCSGATPETPPVAPAPTAVPGPTPEAVAARKTPEETAAEQQGKGCESKTKPREAAYCYLKSESEASIDPLFSLGRTLAEKAEKNPVSYWPDFTYAAENAGVLAAKTREARLYAGLKEASEIDQLFAVRAITHMLATLRWGHAHGKTADEPVRNERLAAAHTACLGKLGTKSPMLVKAAGDCLKEIGDPADTAALVDAALGQTEIDAQAHLLEIVAQNRPVPRPHLQKLAPLLERPLPQKWTHGELGLRATICRILLRQVDAKETWTKKPAEAAVREIGNRNSQAREPCDALAKRN